MYIPEEKGYIVSDSRVRQTTLRVATAVSILTASLLFFMVVPVFPRDLMILLAIGLAALAYKAPNAALILMLLAALPGYLYQLSSALPAGTHLPLPMVAGVCSILLLLATAVSLNEGALGIAIGASAAILMLTPLQFLALPLLIGMAFFRTRGMAVRTAGAVLVFALLYYPFLAINSGVPAGGVVPFLTPVRFQATLPIPVLGLNEISTALGRIVGSSSSAHIPYLAHLADYWPLSPKQRLFPIGLLFCLLAGAGISTLVGMFTFFHWLKKRGVNYTYLHSATPVLSLLAGIAAFYLLSTVLAAPLDFVNTLSITGLLIGAVLIGGCGSIAEIWTIKRDRILEMRDNLAGHAGAIRSQTDFLVERTRQTKEQCYRMDTSAEQSLVQICLQELSFVEQTVADMSPDDLEERMLRFQELQAQLSDSLQESNARIYQYYDEDRQKYNDCLELAQNYGFNLGDNVSGPDFSQLTSMEYDEVLQLQIELNERYQNSARALAEDVKKLEDKLCCEVDADFKRTGIRIASDYFAQELCAEAIQEFLQESGDIERILLGTLDGLDKELLEVLDSLTATLKDFLMPTAVNLGDTTGVKYYEETQKRIDELHDPPVDNPKLPDMMRIISRVGGIGEVISSLRYKLADKIVELQKSIQENTPRGHGWDIDPHIQDRLAEFSRNFNKLSGAVGIHERLSLLKSGPSVLESAARSVREYSIVHELLLNYASLEPLLEEKLADSGVVSFNDLPLKRKYSQDFLKIYCLKHPGKVRIEADTGRLTRL